MEKASRLHLWTVPARLDGLWCGAGGLALRITQQFQFVTMDIAQGNERRSYGGRIDGRILRVWGSAGANWSARADDAGLRITRAAKASGLTNQSLRRLEGATCPARP